VSFPLVLNTCTTIRIMPWQWQ